MSYSTSFNTINYFSFLASVPPLFHVVSDRAAIVQSLNCVRLCDPIDCSPPGSSVHGISQSTIVDWVAISFQEIFPTQGLNLSLLHWQGILYH